MTTGTTEDLAAVVARSLDAVAGAASLDELTALETELLGPEADPQLGLPEGAAPAVVVAAGHRHRHRAGQARQGRGHGERTARDHLPVGEPEFEEVAGDEEGIAEAGGGVEEGEEGRLGLGRRAADMRVCDDEKAVAGHGEG